MTPQLDRVQRLCASMTERMCLVGMHVVGGPNIGAAAMCCVVLHFLEVSPVNLVWFQSIAILNLCYQWPVGGHGT